MVRRQLPLDFSFLLTAQFLADDDRFHFSCPCWSPFVVESENEQLKPQNMDEGK